MNALRLTYSPSLSSKLDKIRHIPVLEKVDNMKSMERKRFVEELFEEIVGKANAPRVNFVKFEGEVFTKLFPDTPQTIAKRLQHFNPQKKRSLTCPQTFDKKCPICEIAKITREYQAKPRVEVLALGLVLEKSGKDFVPKDLGIFTFSKTDMSVIIDAMKTGFDPFAENGNILLIKRDPTSKRKLITPLPLTYTIPEEWKKKAEGFDIQNVITEAKPEDVVELAKYFAEKFGVSADELNEILKATGFSVSTPEPSSVLDEFVGGEEEESSEDLDALFEGNV